MNVVEVVSYLDNGLEIEPYCDICGEYEGDVGVIIHHHMAENQDLNLCPGCRAKLLDALNAKPVGKANYNLNTGETADIGA